MSVLAPGDGPIRWPVDVPAGIERTDYYVSKVTGNTFQLATTRELQQLITRRMAPGRDAVAELAEMCRSREPRGESKAERRLRRRKARQKLPRSGA